MSLLLIGRFLAGRPINGVPKTNARWGHPGSRAFTIHGHASRWSYYPHRRRAGIRLVGLTSAILLAVGFIVSPLSTADTARVLAWGVLLSLAWVVVEKSRRWSHVQTYIIRPAANLAETLGVARGRDPKSWLHVPVGHRVNPDKMVVIDLEPTYHAPVTQQKRHAELAAKLLAMRSPDWGIDWEGAAPKLWLRASPTPPVLVTFEQVRELAEQTAVGEFLLGFESRMVPGRVSLAGDSPHILASIGSGGGKSQFGKWMALQALRRGSRVVIIDIVKRGASHKWAKGVPGVEIYRHPDTAHTTLVELSDLVETRCETYWHHGNAGDDQQILLIIEESNRTLRKLQTYWTQELGESKTSLAVMAIEGILCVGREAGVNAVTVGQRMSAAASGGGDARENYGVRLGNRFSRQTARMLFGDCQPLPSNVLAPGRVQVVIGQTATEMQLPHLPDEDPAPVEWALAGRSTADTGEQLNSTPQDLGKRPVHDTAKVINLPSASGDLVSLSEGASALGMKVTALRNARARDPEFPPDRARNGQQKLYRLEELKRWAPNRAKRSGAAGGVADDG